MEYTAGQGAIPVHDFDSLRGKLDYNTAQECMCCCDSRIFLPSCMLMYALSAPHDASTSLFGRSALHGVVPDDQVAFRFRQPPQRTGGLQLFSCKSCLLSQSLGTNYAVNV